MSKQTKQEDVGETNRRINRGTDKSRKKEGTLTADMPPAGLGAITAGKTEAGETERALKRATTKKPSS